jgi:hypothetical protein
MAEMLCVPLPQSSSRSKDSLGPLFPRLIRGMWHSAAILGARSPQSWLEGAQARPKSPQASRSIMAKGGQSSDMSLNSSQAVSPAVCPPPDLPSLLVSPQLPGFRNFAIGKNLLPPLSVPARDGHCAEKSLIAMGESRCAMWQLHQRGVLPKLVRLRATDPPCSVEAATRNLVGRRLLLRFQSARELFETQVSYLVLHRPASLEHKKN